MHVWKDKSILKHYLENFLLKLQIVQSLNSKQGSKANSSYLNSVEAVRKSRRNYNHIEECRIHDASQNHIYYHSF